MQTDQARQMIDTQLEQLSEALSAGKSEQLQTYLATIGNFHHYSLGNTLLIPGAEQKFWKGKQRSFSRTDSPSPSQSECCL